MFFPKLRRHAKWMFVALALVFGLGFVVFGVGAGGVGIGDVISRQGGAGGGLSVSDARERTQERPNDAAAWQELSTALQVDNDIAGAVVAQRRATELNANDGDALRQLAGLYLALASTRQGEAQLAQNEAALEAAGQNFPNGLVVGGRQVTSDPIGQAVNAEAAVEVNTAIFLVQDAFSNAVDSYQQLAELQPQDPNVQVELAQAAEQAGQPTVAIAAYRQFLKLAPDDPNVSVVRQRIAALQQSVAPDSGSGGSG